VHGDEVPFGLGPQQRIGGIDELDAIVKRAQIGIFI
jgi:hypothetical protein